MLLLAQPTITQQPTDEVVTNGGMAAFSVAVSGTGPFTYQWMFNGSNLSPFITTVAGGGNSFNNGIAATNAALSIQGVTVDSVGDLFITDENNCIRKVDTNGIITTVAGNGTSGYSGDGGGATSSLTELYNPSGVAVDSVGNLFIADTSNNRIRKVRTNGIITTVAGNGTYGYYGDGGVATSAGLNNPSRVAVDSVGNLFIADYNNNRIRKVVSTPDYPSTLSTLTVDNLSSANAGNYSVVITNLSGSITSSVVTLTVILPPTSFTAKTSGTGLQIQFAGTPYYPYILQLATNLTPPINWQSILTNPADVNGNWGVTITNSSDVPAGFYRAAGQ